MAGTLSGGRQQMLAVGRALMGLPRLLLSINGPGGGERDDDDGSRPRSFVYDGNGNLLIQRTGEDDDGAQRFTWDSANRLAAVSGRDEDSRIRYRYDGDGHLYVEQRGGGNDVMV